MSGIFYRDKGSPFLTFTIVEQALAILSLVLAGFSVGISLLGSSVYGHGAIYFSFVAYLVVLMLPFLGSSFRPGVFHPLVFYIIWVGFRGLLEGDAALAVTGLPFHRALKGFSNESLNELVVESFILESVALIALYIGYTITPGIRIRKFNILRATGIKWKSVLWVMVSGIGLVVLIFHAGGIGSVLMQRGLPSVSRVSSEIGGQWNWLAGIGTVVPLVWIAFDKHATRQIFFWSVVIAALSVKFIATGSRGGVIGPLILIGAIWMLRHRKVPYRVVVGGFLIALIAIGILGKFRTTTQHVDNLGDVKMEFSIQSSLRSAVDELRQLAGANNGKLAVLGRVPEEVDFLYGKSYLSIPFVFIPSAILPIDKPDAAGKLNARLVYERPLTAVPPGPVGEAYWNFSYLGVPLIFFLYGSVLKIVGCLYRNNSENSLILVFFVYFLFYMQPHTPSIYQFFHSIVPALAVWLTMVVNWRHFFFRKMLGRNSNVVGRLS